MANVFVSYSRTDKSVAERLAAALEASGISCWLDQHLPGGSTYTDVTEQELIDAASVVVLWTETSVKSNWVKDEAQVGREQGKLVPLSIDGTLPPLGFRQIQAIDFKHWPKDEAPFTALTEALAPLVGDKGHAAVASVASTESRTGKRKRPLILAGLGATALALAGAGYVAFNGFSDGTEALASEPVALAILPFTVIGDFKEGDEQLGPGLAGALNTSLSQLAGLALVSNSGPSLMIESGATLPEMAQRLGVDYFVEGEIKYESKEVILSLSLVDAKTTKQIWRDQFRGPRNFLPVAADDATNELSGVMQTRLGVGKGSIASSSGVDPEAYEAYLRGAQHFVTGQFPDSRLLAIDEFRNSIRIAPNFAPAHAALGLAVSMGVGGQLDTPEGRELASNSIERALELDPQNLIARLAKQNWKSTNKGDIVSALEGMREIVDDHPDSALARNFLAHELAMVGERSESLKHFREARRIDPLSHWYLASYLSSLIAVSNYDEIRREARDCFVCSVAVYNWAMGVVWLTDDEEFPEELAQVIARASSLGIPEEDLREFEALYTAMREGKPNPLPGSEFTSDIDSVMALAEFGEYEAALARLDEFESTLFSADFRFFLDTPRKEWPEAVRADPRYHVIFDTLYLQSAIEERRKRGHTQNLPVSPVKPYEGP